MLGTTTPALCVCLLAVGCGASAKDVREAKASGYRTDFAVVYSQTLEAVRELYPEVTEDPKNGVIKTAWHPLKIRQQVGETQSGSGPTQPLSTGSQDKLYFVRFTVRVAGGSPWRVRIEGEASSWRMGEVPTPLRGGEVPAWLEGRTDALQLAVHERLARFAVPVYENAEPTADAGPVAAEAVDPSRFPGLPTAAAQVIFEVEKAAQQNDIATLRQHMAGEFQYSAGSGAAEPETALAVFQADPAMLEELVRVIGTGCAAVKDSKVVCPKEAATGEVVGYRVGFVRADGVWRFAYFYDAR